MSRQGLQVVMEHQFLVTVKCKVHMFLRDLYAIYHLILLYIRFPLLATILQIHMYNYLRLKTTRLT